MDKLLLTATLVRGLFSSEYHLWSSSLATCTEVNGLLGPAPNVLLDLMVLSKWDSHYLQAHYCNNIAVKMFASGLIRFIYSKSSVAYLGFGRRGVLRVLQHPP